jgi:PPM family protein phosphatase
MPARSKRPLLIAAVALLIALSAGLAGCARLPSFIQDLSPSPSPTADPALVNGDSGATDPAPGPSGVLPGLDRLADGSLENVGVGVLIALGVLAVVFLVVTAAVVYLLIRRPLRKRRRTGGLESGPPDSGPQDAFRKGALVADGRYTVLGPVGAEKAPRERISAARAAYEVEPTAPLFLCPHCYSTQRRQNDAPPPSLCSNCGGGLSLQQNPGESAPFIAREIGAEHFAVVSEMLTRKLAHWALVLPVDVFAAAGSDATRYYQIEPKILNAPASVIEAPQLLGQILTWGETLARGLDYLHQHQIVLREPAGTGPALAGHASGADEWTPEQVADRIVLDGDEARWLCFDHVGSLATVEEREVLAVCQQNVRELAGYLLKLATGESGSGGLSQLPVPVKAMFGAALARDAGISAARFVTLLEENRRELAYQKPVQLRMGAQSDVGRLRKLNEDSMLAKDYSDLFAAVNVTVGVVAVADGVGGNSAGDVASRLTIEALADFGDGLRQTAANGLMPDPEPWIVQAASAANGDVYRERQAASSDMGCTLVMALLVGSAATLLNVGDSRAYRLRPQGINQVTTDHSLVQRLIDIGQLTREEARHHPHKSVIYRVMGDTSDLAYDIYNVILKSGEALLLCSDGLTDMVGDDVLWQVWRAAASPDEACRRLVTLANEAGGYDNITVVIAQIA